MILELSSPSESEYWEHLYNNKQICEALVHEGVRVAEALFRSKVYHMHNVHGPFCEETAYILLTSLNRSLYDYLVMQSSLSFTKCCYENRAHMHDVSDLDAILRSGSRIVNAYGKCIQEGQANHSRIEKACSYINAHISEELTLAKVSSEIYLSKNHLCSIFKNLTGLTFCDYVRQQRIQHARILLATTDRSIDAIAASCGFNSSTYFSTVFKNEMGMTPSVFRQEYRL